MHYLWILVFFISQQCVLILSQRLISKTQQSCIYDNVVNTNMAKTSKVLSELKDRFNRLENTTLDMKSMVSKIESKTLTLQNDLPKATKRMDNLENMLYTNFFSNIQKVRTYSGKRYMLMKSRSSWQDAKATCNSVGADLVYIPNSATQSMLKNLVSQYNNDVWIGAYRKSGNVFEWETINGSKEMRWSSWAPGEPYNDDRYCVQMWKDEYYKWDDDFCYNLKRFVCTVKD